MGFDFFGKRKSKKIAIESVIPTEFNLFEEVDIKLVDINETPIMQADLESYFRNYYTAIYNINGEISGHAICQINSDESINIDEEKEELRDIFLESSNIIIGNILTYADKNLHLLAHISSPLIINQEERQQSDEHFKILRIISLLNKSLNDFEPYKLDYQFTYMDHTVSFHIVLLVHINESKVES